MSSAGVSEASTQPDVEPAQAQRPEAVGVAHADGLRLVHDHERERALEPGHDRGDDRLEPAGLGGIGRRGSALDVAPRRVDRPGRGELVGVGACRQLAADQLGHEVAVAGDRALEHAGLLGQRLGVDEVAVVAEREHVLAHRPVGGLGVAPRGRAGGRVAAVADGEVAVQPRQGAVVEHAGDEALVLDDREQLAVADRHARGLLAAVLQGEQRQVGEVGHRLAGGVEGDDPTRLLGVVVAVVGRRPLVRVAHGPSLPGGDPRTANPDGPPRCCIRHTRFVP